MTTPAITLVICTYNNCQLLDVTLRAIERQKGADGLAWDVLVIDNNCTDATAEVVDRYIQAGRIPGLRRVVETRQGLAHARRRGMVDSTAPIVAFIDDDCELATDWVVRTVEFARDHPRAGAVGSRVSLVWEREPDALCRAFAASFSPQEYGPRSRQLSEGDIKYLVGAGLVVRREAVLASGWMDHQILVDRCGNKLSAGGDLEMIFRIRNAGCELWYCAEMHVDHHVPARRMNDSYLRSVMRGIGRSYAIVETLRQGRQSTMGWRIWLVHWALGRYVGATLRCMRDWISPSQVNRRAHVLARERRRGDLEGALRFLWHGMGTPDGR